MRRHRILGVLSLLLAVLPVMAAERGTAAWRRPVRVLTQNLYVGVDILRILQAESPEQIPVIAAEMYAMVQATDFPSRAARVAEEVAAENPDVIGLQEVSTIVRLSPGDPPSVEVLDFLAVLRAELAGLGLSYEVGGMVTNADVEVPAITETGLGLVRLVDHDVILVRSGMPVADVHAVNYEAQLEIPIGDPPVAVVELTRGYVSLVTEIGRRPFRVVTTHLELQGADLDPQVPFIQAMQAHQLIQTLAADPLPVILTGDLNSNPEAPVVGPLVPPYLQFRAAGYDDLWLRRPGPPVPGLTCCQAEDLLNDEPAFVERIDVVFARPGAGDPVVVGPVAATLVGARPEDRTDAGLWPSDHAGVSVRVHLPTRVRPAELRWAEFPLRGR